MLLWGWLVFSSGVSLQVLPGLFKREIFLRGSGAGFRVSGSGFRAAGFGFRISGSGFRVPGFGFRVSGSGIQDPGSGFWVSGFGFRVSGFGFRVSGSGFRVSGLGGTIACEMILFYVNIFGSGTGFFSGVQVQGNISLGFRYRVSGFGFRRGSGFGFVFAPSGTARGQSTEQYQLENSVGFRWDNGVRNKHLAALPRLAALGGGHGVYGVGEREAGTPGRG
jgi:hypothetical protein